jgi:hypothetical protein
MLIVIFIATGGGATLTWCVTLADYVMHRVGHHETSRDARTRKPTAGVGPVTCRWPGHDGYNAW